MGVAKVSRLRLELMNALCDLNYMGVGEFENNILCP